MYINAERTEQRVQPPAMQAREWGWGGEMQCKGMETAASTQSYWDSPPLCPPFSPSSPQLGVPESKAHLWLLGSAQLLARPPLSPSPNPSWEWGAVISEGEGL